MPTVLVEADVVEQIGICLLVAGVMGQVPCARSLANVHDIGGLQKGFNLDELRRRGRITDARQAGGRDTRLLCTATPGCAGLARGHPWSTSGGRKMNELEVMIAFILVGFFLLMAGYARRDRRLGAFTIMLGILVMLSTLGYKLHLEFVM